MKPYFLMTVDVDPFIPSKRKWIIENGVISLLNLFDKNAIKATFFVPGAIAEKFPATIEEIANKKHEVACHGLMHNASEANLDVYKQIRTIKNATEIIENITGQRPVGFRAPLFKANRNCWIALQKNSYIYDSSIVCSPLYRNKNFGPFLGAKPYYLPIPKNDEDNALLEIPVSINPFLPLPLGGSWFRILGLKWAKIGVKMNFFFQIPVVFYIHPNDLFIFPELYHLDWYLYKNNQNCMEMLNKIIVFVRHQEAQFLTASELAKIVIGKNNS